MTHNHIPTPTARFLTFAVALLVLLVSPAYGYDARVGWNPVSDAKGYKVYVGNVSTPFGAPINVGKPATENDGIVRVYVQDLPVGPDLRFAVAAFDDAGNEGAKSNEIMIAYAQVASVIDTDDDGLTDAQEDKNLNGKVDSGETDPNKADTDGDGLSDGAEVNKHGTKPLNPDTDGDGLTDGEEINEYKTNPKDSDSDGDGIADGDEVDGGSDPKNPSSGASCGNGRVEGSEECDDGNASNDDGCLANCKDAECIPGQSGCGDNNPCTTDSCTEGRCVSSNNNNACDDGIACTSNDRCSSGSCSGSDSCRDGSTCVEQTGQCEAVVPVDGKWIPAATYPAMRLRGDMVAGVEYTHGTDVDPFADSLEPLLLYPDTSSSTLDAGSGDETIYTLKLPSSGRWYLWGRLYYPGTGNDANSFFVRVDAGNALKFGNNKDVFRQWHWDGDGNIENGSGRPLSLGDLAVGSHKLVVEKREADGAKSPRLDVFFLTQDPTMVPSDDEARIALEVCPQGVCAGDGGADVCGDATGDGAVTVVDAWSILTASISVAQSCGLAVCDVDANDHVNATDALIALRAAVGVDVNALVCGPAVGFEVLGASKLTSVDFTVNYASTGVSFGSGADGFVCEAAMPSAVGALTVYNDVGRDELQVGVDFREPVSGDLHVVECRFTSSNGLPIPATFSISLDGYTRVGSRTAATTPKLSSTVLLP